MLGEAAIGPKAKSLMYRALGTAALGLAVIGAVLPLMPTTVFVLLAAWAFARGSPRLHAMLYDHPRFGPVLVDWERYGAISRKAKVLAVAGMTVSWIAIALLADHWMGPALALAVMLAGGAYVLSRPTPPRKRGERKG